MPVAKRRPALVGSRQFERDKLDAALMMVRHQILVMDKCHHPKHQLTADELEFAKTVIAIACDALMPREVDEDDG